MAVYIAKEIKCATACSMSDPSQTNFAKTSQYCKVNGSNSWHYRSFLEYDLSGMPKDSKIVSAKLRMYVNYRNDSGYNGYINIARCTTSWEEDTLCWNLQPLTEGTYLESNINASSINYWMEIDITSLVNEWVLGIYPNYGLYLKNINESSYRTDWNVVNHYHSSQELATYIEINYQTDDIYGIRESRVRDLADQVRRLTSTSDLLTIDEMITGLTSVEPYTEPKLQDKIVTENGEIVADSGYDGLGTITVNVSGSIDGLTNGYDVMFYKEDNEALSFYSIKQGQAINPPIYSCKNWIDQNGVAIVFPYTPTADISLWADSSTFSALLYNHFGISPEEYPYIAIACFFNGNVSQASTVIYFANSLSNVKWSDGSTKPKYTKLKLISFANHLFNSEINEIVEYILDNFTIDDITTNESGTYGWADGSAYKYHINHSLIDGHTVTNYSQFE